MSVARQPCTHHHAFITVNTAAARNTALVTWITAAAMLAEIVAGLAFNSMALLADGIHMGTHAFALGLAALAYRAARRYAGDPRFSFGTWKIEILAAYTSAILLGVAALMMIAGSIERLIAPQPIRFGEAIIVAILGLLVNLVCALILGGTHDHHHGHAHGHDHAHGHHSGHSEDLNLKSAYVHVLTDALTSVLAILALAGGWLWGWHWLDPVMGIVGALVISIWAVSLIRQSSAVLLDREMDHPVVAEIAAVMTDAGATLTDLHVWRVGQGAYACALAVTTADPALTPDHLRQQLAVHEEVVHATIEVRAV